MSTAAIKYMGLLQGELRALDRDGRVTIPCLPQVAEELRAGDLLTGTADGRRIPLRVVEVLPREEKRVSQDVHLELVKDTP